MDEEKWVKDSESVPGLNHCFQVMSRLSLRSLTHAHATFIHPAKTPPPDSAADKEQHVLQLSLEQLIPMLSHAKSSVLLVGS